MISPKGKPLGVDVALKKKRTPDSYTQWPFSGRRVLPRLELRGGAVPVEHPRGPRAAALQGHLHGARHLEPQEWTRLILVTWIGGLAVKKRCPIYPPQEPRVQILNPQSKPPTNGKLVLDMAMGQNPNHSPSEHPNPNTKIGSEMGGEFTYPKMGFGFDPQHVTKSGSDRTTFK